MSHAGHVPLGQFTFPRTDHLQGMRNGRTLAKHAVELVKLRIRDSGDQRAWSRFVAGVCAPSFINMAGVKGYKMRMPRISRRRSSAA